MSRTLIAMMVLAGCEKPAIDARSAPTELQCARDEECALLPTALTCCIECPPAPPFEAAASWVLDGMLIENETVCAEPRHLCPPVTCDPLPEGCVARAACVAGRCAALAQGCELPTT